MTTRPVETEEHMVARRLFSTPTLLEGVLLELATMYRKVGEHDQTLFADKLNLLARDMPDD